MESVKLNFRRFHLSHFYFQFYSNLKPSTFSLRYCWASQAQHQPTKAATLKFRQEHLKHQQSTEQYSKQKKRTSRFAFFVHERITQLLRQEIQGLIKRCSQHCSRREANRFKFRNQFRFQRWFFQLTKFNAHFNHLS